MRQEEQCNEMLAQLKGEYPLPEGTVLRVFYVQTDLIRKGRSTGGATFQMVCGEPYIHIAMGDSVNDFTRLERMAHEYWHAYQRLVLGMTINPNYNSLYERQAREFARGYTKEYTRRRCIAA